MRRVAYDIETDGFLDDYDGQKMTKVHCIVVRDLDTDEVRCFHEADHIHPRHGSLTDAVELIASAEVRTAHNAVGFDEPVLREWFGFIPLLLEEPEKYHTDTGLSDTFVASRYLWTDVEKTTKESNRFRAKRGEPTVPPDLVASHSLKAWGHRLGQYKGSCDEFSVFTQDMLDYCIQDTAVLSVLYHRCLGKLKDVGHSHESVVTEHAFAEVLRRQERMGIYFDMASAKRLWRQWDTEIIEIDERLQREVEPWVTHYVTPKKKLERTRVTPFNPNSRQQVARLYEERYGHKFTEKTDSGQWEINEGTLRGLVMMNLPHAVDIERRFLLQKRISALAVNQNPKALPWMEAVCADGRVHPRINGTGAVSHRCTHSKFNITGVPRVTSPFGAECRALFTASPGWIMAGGDASGLENCILAHLLYKYDGGACVQVVMDGDLHEENRKRFGFEDHDSMSGRDRTKTFWYAWLYGAGQEKLGRIAVNGIRYVSEAQAKRIGREKVGNLLESFPGLDALKRAINKHLTGTREPKFRQKLIRPYLRSLDGRVLTCRSTHSALNLACQGGGAVVMKIATILVDERMQEKGWQWKTDYGQVIHAHDEMQYDCRTEEVADDFCEAIEWAVPEAGRRLKLHCPLRAESKKGSNWSETH